MKRALPSVLLAAVLAAGCTMPYTEAPLATNFETTKQKKLQAAQHWHLIAEDVAKQISADIGPSRVLHVQLPDDAPPFKRAFLQKVTTTLVNEGHRVMLRPEGAMQIEVDVQVVAFAPDRPQYMHGGAITAVSGSLWLLRDAALSDNFTTGTMFAAGGLDALAWFRAEFATGATPQTEVIVNAMAYDASEFVARSTTVYYAEDKDLLLYAAVRKPTPPVTIGVKGDQ